MRGAVQVVPRRNIKLSIGGDGLQLGTTQVPAHRQTVAPHHQILFRFDSVALKIEINLVGGIGRPRAVNGAVASGDRGLALWRHACRVATVRG